VSDGEPGCYDGMERGVLKSKGGEKGGQERPLIGGTTSTYHMLTVLSRSNLWWGAVRRRTVKAIMGRRKERGGGWTVYARLGDGKVLRYSYQEGGGGNAQRKGASRNLRPRSKQKVRTETKRGGAPLFATSHGGISR